MPRNVSVDSLVTRCKRRADRENDSHISDAEWIALIEEVYGSDIHGVLVASGSNYFESEQTIVADGSASYDGPNDHMATLGVYYEQANGQRTRLRAAQQHERHTLRNQTSSQATSWEMIGEQVWLYPRPSSGTYKHTYVPQASEGLTSLDTLDVVNSDGLATLTWGVAVIALAKSEADVTLARAEAEKYRGRLQVWAAERALNEPRAMERPFGGGGDGLDDDPASWRYRP